MCFRFRIDRPLAVSAIVVMAMLTLVADVRAAAAPPASARTIDTTYVSQGGPIIRVNAGGDLQAALDRAEPGDTIVLQAGATFAGSFVLPRKAASDSWIYVQSSAYSDLPAPGTRVTPAGASIMAKIVANGPNEPALKTASGASRFRFVGIEVMPAPGRFVVNLIQIGDGETSADELPSWIVFDRCFIHGDPQVGGRRGIAANGRNIGVVDSHVSDFKEQGADSQAVWASNTPGPLKIVNNYLEAAGENFLLGGADPSIAGAVPSDVEVRGNLIMKPLKWLAEQWVVKNSLELKAGRRVLITDNTIANNWEAGQTGFAVLFTPRNQDGTAPWTKVSDVTFTSNRLLNVSKGVNISGMDDLKPSERTERILIRDNFMQITGLRADGTVAGANKSGARMFQLLDGPSDVVIDHNTAVFEFGSAGVIMMVDSRAKASGFEFTNNIVEKGEYGFFGSGAGEGLGAIDAFFSTPVFRRNALIGASSGSYPVDNFFPEGRAAVGFVNGTDGDFRLGAGSPFKSAATDRTDLGARGEVARTVGSSVTKSRPKSPPGVRVD